MLYASLHKSRVHAAMTGCACPNASVSTRVSAQSETACHRGTHFSADGVEQMRGGAALILENLCQGYTRPFICDIKLGFHTTYAWASEHYNLKNRYAPHTLPESQIDQPCTVVHKHCRFTLHDLLDADTSFHQVIVGRALNGLHSA